MPELTEQIRKKADELLKSGRVTVVIGYGEGTAGKIRPVFVRQSSGISQLIWDDRCRQNLAVYLTKREIRKLGRAAIVSNPVVVMTIIQLVSENQLKSSDLSVLAGDNGGVIELDDDKSLESYVKSHPVVLPPVVESNLKSVTDKDIQNRFAHWQDELSRCFKCYACRAACPLCYCERCITDCNQPQWLSVPSNPVGIFEWHLNRAMHLAGRCVECGSCTAACPVGIPVGLFTNESAGIVRDHFGHRPGISCTAISALSTFKLEDTEDFIE